MTDEKPEGDAPLQDDGTHMVPPEFQDLAGRAELTDDGQWRYVPGKGEPGYNPADWAS